MAEQLNNSVLTAFDILGLFSERRQTISSQDVRKELQLGAATAHRFLRSLESAGALVSGQRGQYRLGLKFIDLGANAAAANVLLHDIQAILEELANETQETAIAAVLKKQKVTILARANSPRPYSIHMDIGAELELHCTANGKLWLANFSQEEYRKYLRDSKREAFTKRTICGEEQLKAEIDKVRQHGYAICIGEREEEISAIGKSVYTDGGNMFVSISIFGPNSHFDESFNKRALIVLDRAVNRIRGVQGG